MTTQGTHTRFSQSRAFGASLPTGWRISEGYLIDNEGVHRHILKPDGKIDADKVETILLNAGHAAFARLWTHAGRQDELIAELSGALEELLADDYVRKAAVNWATDALLRARAAIAKARG